jgi:hypothetical protein
MIRNYTFVDSDDHPSTRLRQMNLSINDCAMACDKDPNCRSITWWNDRSWGPDGSCFTNREPQTNRPKAPNNNWFGANPPQNYDKPETVTTRNLIKTKSISAPNTSYATGKRYGQGNGREYCDSAPYQNVPSGNQEVSGSGSCGRGKRCCRQDFLGVAACSIPGIVWDVDKDGTDNVICGYTDIDNTWIETNWNDLSSFFDAANMEKVKQQFCDTSSPATIAGSPGNNYCKQFILNKNGSQPESVWYNYLTDNMSKRSGWSSDQDAIRLVIQSCKNGGADTGTGCNSAINTLPIGSVKWSSPLIAGLNDLNSSTVPADQLKTLSEKVEAYCSTQENSAECGCRNAVKYKVDGCTVDKPGCEDLVPFKTFKDSLSSSGTPNYGNILTLINGIRPRVQAHACRLADGSESGNILQFGKPQAGDKIQINACIQTLQNSGTLDVNKVDMACDISNPQTTTAPGTGENSPVKKVIKIGAGVLCCILILVFILLIL